MAAEPVALTATDTHLERIARSGSLNMLGAVVASACNFLLVVVVTKSFDQSTAGMLFSVTSVFLVLLSASSLGTDGGLARFMLRFDAVGRSADIPACVRAARVPVVVVSLALAATTALLAPWLAPLIGLDGHEGPYALIALAALLPVAALGDFSLSGTRAFGTMRSTVLVDKVIRPALQPLAAWVISLSAGGILALAASWAVPYAVAAGVSIYVFHRLLRNRGLLANTAPITERKLIGREFWSFTWARGIARLCQMLLQRSDIILIAALLSVRDAAIYTAATRFVALGQFGVNAIQQVLQPRFSQMLAKGQTAEASAVFKIATSWNMAVAWPLYMVTGTASGYYLLIFGSGYRDGSATAVVVLMSAAMLFGVAAGPLDTLLLMAGGSRTSLWISLSALAVDIGLCLLLIPGAGIAGAAAAWAASVVIRNALSYFSVRRALSMSPFSRSAVLVALANLACFGVPFLLLTLSNQRNLLAFLGVLAASCTAYACLLWLLRKPLGLAAFRSLRHRKPAPGRALRQGYLDDRK